MARAVLDSSAVIAVLRAEPGADVAAGYLDDAVISAVNLQEVAKKLIEAGFSDEQARQTLDALALEVQPHDAEDAIGVLRSSPSRSSTAEASATGPAWR